MTGQSDGSLYAWFYLQNTDCIVFSSLVDLSQPSISL